RAGLCPAQAERPHSPGGQGRQANGPRAAPRQGHGQAGADQPPPPADRRPERGRPPLRPLPRHAEWAERPPASPARLPAGGRLAVFSSSDSAVADVNVNGLVQFQQSGEVAILCRYLDEMLSVRLTYLEPKKGFAWANPPESNYVDKHVFAKLKMLSIQPSEVC